jgi:lipopolysaccharide/colanic/teichoic acid biosynthesis glycosyltransferase
VVTSTSITLRSDLGSRWCFSRGKRCVDVTASAFGLLLLSPVLFVIALGIQTTSGAPILFRQRRVGRYGREFQLLKFRTMTATATQNSPGLTQHGDPRITGIGRWLRRWKLDELPQLFNVLKGDMTLVGPRPDLEKFWSRATIADRRVLLLTPGVTGAASIAFRDEENLLAQVPPERLTSFYIEQLLPQKARIDREYAARATLRSDCEILLQTVFEPLFQRRGVHKKTDKQFSDSEKFTSDSQLRGTTHVGAD